MKNNMSMKTLYLSVLLGAPLLMLGGEAQAYVAVTVPGAVVAVPVPATANVYRGYGYRNNYYHSGSGYYNRGTGYHNGRYGTTTYHYGNGHGTAVHRGNGHGTAVHNGKVYHYNR